MIMERKGEYEQCLIHSFSARILTVSQEMFRKWKRFVTKLPT